MPEREIIQVLQDGLPLVERPFQPLAEKLGITVEELLRIISDFCEQGLIRRFGATLRQKEIGYTANAMVVWNVPEGQADSAGSVLAGFQQVTHCYRRPRKPGWPYNLFTMIHGSSRSGCQMLAQEMALAAGIADYALLYSVRELKKSSMRYY